MKKMTAPAVSEIRDASFWIGGKPAVIYSGEIHYFRIPKKFWKAHLRRAKEAGLNTVSTYIPWSWHEPGEGTFDFDGKTHPQRGLTAYVKMVKDAGLYLLARVGPVSNAELVNEGVPAWLLEKYPEVYVQRERLGNLPHAMLLSYLNPTFLERVRRWYDRVLPIVAGAQIHRGGPVVLVQLCNEIAMIHWLHKAADLHPRVTGMYRDFLREKYGSVADLNSAYGSGHASWEEIEQPEGDVSEKSLPRFFDWALFYRRYYAAYFGRLHDLARERGITVPLSANIPQFYDYDVRGRGVYSPMTTSLFRDFPEKAPRTIFGGAYQLRRMDFENFHDIPMATEVIRMLDRSVPSICAELQTGIMRDRPRLYPQDVDLNLAASLAHGLDGVNCYMFSAGRNLPGMGAFGSTHDWQAPVSLDGAVKPHFEPIRRWGAWLNKHGESLALTRKVPDLALGFYLPYYATEYFRGEWTARVEALRTGHFYDGIARLIQLAGYNFAAADLMKDGLDTLLKFRSLCVHSIGLMDARTQDKLAEFVRRGGNLLIGPAMPRRDLSGKKCENLLKSLHVSARQAGRTETVRWREGECWVESLFDVFDPGPYRTVLKTASGRACAVAGRSGPGRWLAYGFPVPHLFDYQVGMVREWLRALEIEPRVRIEPWDAQAVLRWGNGRGFLFIFNYHDVPMEGRVAVRLKEFAGTPYRAAFRLDRRSCRAVALRRIGNKIVGEGFK